MHAHGNGNGNYDWAAANTAHTLWMMLDRQASIHNDKARAIWDAWASASKDTTRRLLIRDFHIEQGRAAGLRAAADIAKGEYESICNS